MRGSARTGTERRRSSAALTAVGVLAVLAFVVPAVSAGGGARADTGLPPTFLGTIGGPGHAGMYPSGLEYSAYDDTLVVADTGNHKIEKFDPMTGVLVWAVGGYGTGASKFSDPRDVGVGSDGSIYVADTGNSRIVKLDPDGSWVGFARGPGTDPVGSPIGLSVSTVDGEDQVYIADGLKLKVRVWNDDLDTQLTVASSNGNCQFSNVRDADADADGNIYVANYLKNDILKLDPDGTCITKWGSKGTQNGEFKNPYGVRVVTDPEDGIERVYVADSNNNRVQVFGKGGAFVDKFGQFGVENAVGTFSALRRVAVSPDGDLWGADLWGFSIEHADATGMHDGPGGAYDFADSVPRDYSPPPFSSGALFNEVRQVAFDNAGDLLAMDTVNQRVVRFQVEADPDTGEVTGTLLPPACGKRGWQPGAFNWPRGVAVDPDTNNIWIADTKQNQLQLLQGDCTFVQKMPPVTTSSDKFNWPHAVAIRDVDDTLWVADTKNNRIKVYDTDTKALITIYGGKGSGTGQFLQPKGISIDPSTGNILVADTNNNRIVELTATPGADTITWLRSRNGFKKPSGIARDAAGRTYVADSANNRMLVLDAADWLEVYATVTGMSKPEQVTIGPDGRIYLSDTYHDRILVYAYTE